MSNDFDDCAAWTEHETAKRIAERNDHARRILDGSLLVEDLAAGEVPLPPEDPNEIALGRIADIETAQGVKRVYMGLPPTVDSDDHVQVRYANEGIAPVYRDLLGKKVGETWTSSDPDFGEVTVVAVMPDGRLDGLIAELGQMGTSGSARFMNGRKRRTG